MRTHTPSSAHSHTHMTKHTHGTLPGNRRFPRALKVITWQQPDFFPSLIPLSSPPCCHAFILFNCFSFFSLSLPPFSLFYRFAHILSPLWGVARLTSCWPQHRGGEVNDFSTKGSIAKMGAHPLELWLLLSHNIHSDWMLLSLLMCGNNTELPAVHAAVKDKWFPHQSQIFVCVCLSHHSMEQSGFCFRSLMRAVWSEDWRKQTKRQG